LPLNCAKCRMPCSRVRSCAGSNVVLPTSNHI
jgi:hypothetical protein